MQNYTNDLFNLIRGKSSLQNVINNTNKRESNFKKIIENRKVVIKKHQYDIMKDDMQKDIQTVFNNYPQIIQDDKSEIIKQTLFSLFPDKYEEWFGIELLPLKQDPEQMKIVTEMDEEVKNKIIDNLKESNVEYDKNKIRLLKYKGPGQYHDIKKLTDLYFRDFVPNAMIDIETREYEDEIQKIKNDKSLSESEQKIKIKTLSEEFNKKYKKYQSKERKGLKEKYMKESEDKYKNEFDNKSLKLKEDYEKKMNEIYKEHTKAHQQSKRENENELAFLNVRIQDLIRENNELKEKENERFVSFDKSKDENEDEKIRTIIDNANKDKERLNIEFKNLLTDKENEFKLELEKMKIGYDDTIKLIEKNSKREIDNLNDNIKKLKEELTSLELLNRNLSEDCDNKIREIKNKSRDGEDKIKEYKDKIKDNEKILRDLSIDLEKNKKMNNDLIEKIKKLESDKNNEIDNLKESLKKCYEDNDKLIKESDRLTKKEFMEPINQQKILDLENQVNTLNNELNKNKKLMNDLTNEANDMIKTLEYENLKKNQKITDFDNKFNIMVDEYNKLKNNLNEKDENILMLNKEMKNLVIEYNQLMDYKETLEQLKNSKSKEEFENNSERAINKFSEKNINVSKFMDIEHEEEKYEEDQEKYEEDQEILDMYEKNKKTGRTNKMKLYSPDKKEVDYSFTKNIENESKYNFFINDINNIQFNEFIQNKFKNNTLHDKIKNYFTEFNKYISTIKKENLDYESSFKPASDFITHIKNKYKVNPFLILEDLITEKKFNKKFYNEIYKNVFPEKEINVKIKNDFIKYNDEKNKDYDYDKIISIYDEISHPSYNFYDDEKKYNEFLKGFNVKNNLSLKDQIIKYFTDMNKFIKKEQDKAYNDVSLNSAINFVNYLKIYKLNPFIVLKSLVGEKMTMKFYNSIVEYFENINRIKKGQKD